MYEKTERRLEQLRAAIGRLEVAVEVPPAQELAVDGTIQRFEFIYELAWKTMQALLQAHGVEVASPRAAFRAAFAQGWIEDESRWLGMLEDRNRTSPTYDEPSALAIYERVRRDHLPLLQDASATLGDVVGNG